uniref:Uncharacterized protein n=1 Tax=Ananas comosus var. bracteatus TaxID=296719 RepID=A0A6V7Q239_ANACO|nr:unnamed protein product [Ananas comosus var. bracteatus]
MDEVENIAKSDVTENTKCVLEEEMGAAVKRVDAEYVRRLQGEDGWQRQLELGWEAVRKCGGATEAGFDMNVFSSWLRLPVYEVNFGWGPAAWACMTQLRPSSIVVLPRRPPRGTRRGWRSGRRWSRSRWRNSSESWKSWSPEPGPPRHPAVNPDLSSSIPSRQADRQLPRRLRGSGVEFFEALAPDADLSEILSSDEPNLDELKKFPL